MSILNCATSVLVLTFDMHSHHKCRRSSPSFTRHMSIWSPDTSISEPKDDMCCFLFSNEQLFTILSLPFPLSNFHEEIMQETLEYSAPYFHFEFHNGFISETLFPYLQNSPWFHLNESHNHHLLIEVLSKSASRFTTCWVCLVTCLATCLCKFTTSTSGCLQLQVWHLELPSSMTSRHTSS